MVRRFSNRICASGAAIFISLMGLTEALDRLLEEWKLRCGARAPFARIAVVPPLKRCDSPSSSVPPAGAS